VSSALWSESQDGMQTARIKIVVIGSKAVGKTSLLNAIVSNRDDDYRPFDNVSTMTVTVEKDGTSYSMELWDTKSVDYYKIIDEMQNEELSAVLICYSVMELQTFNDVKKKVRRVTKSVNNRRDAF
jgi:small GTP-binding protein